MTILFNILLFWHDNVVISASEQNFYCGDMELKTTIFYQDGAEQMDTTDSGRSNVRSFQYGGKEIKLPRGKWRVAILVTEAKCLFLRFATKCTYSVACQQ